MVSFYYFLFMSDNDYNHYFIFINILTNDYYNNINEYIYIKYKGSATNLLIIKRNKKIPYWSI